jgi:uracil-DNA glycosylase family 4
MAVEGKDNPEIRAYLEYFRDMGVYDFYRRGEAHPVAAEIDSLLPVLVPTLQERTTDESPHASASPVVPRLETPAAPVVPASPVALETGALGGKLRSFNDLAPLPETRVAAADRAAALRGIQQFIGDCTRCPLAYAGRRTIVFGDGDPNARLMFVGEGPGADEDAQGLPFVGKSGQLLNNMIGAMGLKREQVYIANIVKCRPPANRAPEPAEANTCTQFLLKQMDVVRPEFVVALGAPAATYLLGVKQSLASLRGRFHEVRGAKAVVTFHPAFLLRDPRQKGEAWKDLQMVMAAMGLKAGSRE